jgi:hypothetical protein
MSDYQFADFESPFVRRLKLLVALLLLSNIALGGFGFYFLHTINRRYSELIDRTLPTLTDLRSLAAETTQAMRKTNPSVFVQPKEDRSKLLAQGRLALETDRNARENLLRRDSVVGSQDDQSAMRAAGDAFDKTAAGVLNLIEANRMDEAERARDQSLRGSYDRYLEKTTEAANRVESSSLKASDNLSSQTSQLSKVMLGLGGWPLLIPVILLLSTLVFVILLALNVYSFKRKAISA